MRLRWVGAVGGHGRPPVTFHMSPGSGEGESLGDPCRKSPPGRKAMVPWGIMPHLPSKWRGDQHGEWSKRGREGHSLEAVQETGFTEGSGIRCEEAEATVIP